MYLCPHDAWGTYYDVLVEVRGQAYALGSLLPPQCGLGGSNSGLQTWVASALPTEQFTAPSFPFLVVCFEVQNVLFLMKYN